MMTCEPAEASEAERPMAATRTYLCPRRDQMFLLPVSMRDWIAEGHLAWFVLDVVAEIDTSNLHQRPCLIGGRPAYEPETMCALVLYSYCRGLRSSRQIEAACQTDAAFKVICGGLEPDHATISRFVASRQQALGALFAEGLRLCFEAGLADLSVVALDGTKVAADASLAKNRDREWIEREVCKLIALTGEGANRRAGRRERAGAAPERRGRAPRAPAGGARGDRRRRRRRGGRGTSARPRRRPSTPAAARWSAAASPPTRRRHSQGPRPTTRSRASASARCARERERRERAAGAGERPLPKAPPPCRIRRAAERLERAEADLAAAREAAQEAPKPARQANVTDPDSRIMKTQKGWVQGYNAQAIASRDQIVIACKVSNDASDAQLLEPMAAELERSLAAAGIASRARAAAGRRRLLVGGQHDLPRPRPPDRDDQRPQAPPRRPRARRGARTSCARRDSDRGDGAPPSDPPGRERLRPALGDHRARLRQRQTQPLAARLSPPRARRRTRRVGLRLPDLEHAQAPPLPPRSGARLNKGARGALRRPRSSESARPRRRQRLKLPLAWRIRARGTRNRAAKAAIRPRTSEPQARERVSPRAATPGWRACGAAKIFARRFCNSLYRPVSNQ